MCTTIPSGDLTSTLRLPRVPPVASIFKYKCSKNLTSFPHAKASKPKDSSVPPLISIGEFLETPDLPGAVVQFTS